MADGPFVSGGETRREASCRQARMGLEAEPHPCNAELPDPATQVIRKFNLAYNQKSLDTNMLPGNTMLHWKVNQPMGNFQIKQTSERVADMGAATGDNVALWTNVDYTDIDSDRQYHLLYFSTNNSLTSPAPNLTIRVNYTFTSKET